VSVAVQQAQKPAYEASDPVKTDLVPGPTAKYCVQIGAYKLRENADVVASAAETRFARAVYTIHDAGTDLFKVMIGDFATKDEARSFRDRMVQQYPGEYKDAWVSELAK
jgi:cell division septation protein DedD